MVDTGTYWSGFGQGVILALIQVGGFGIMTMASLLALLVSGKLRLRMQLTAAAETKSLAIGDVRRVLLGVAGTTAAVELAVWAVLALRFRFGYAMPIGDAVYHGFFHSVSAFNNAGFALQPDSLTRYATDPLVTLPIAVAVVLGGIGFPSCSNCCGTAPGGARPDGAAGRCTPSSPSSRRRACWRPAPC